MKTPSILKTFAQHIAEIPGGSLKLLLFVLPPFHLLYLYAVNSFVHERQESTNQPTLLYFLGLLLVALIFTLVGLIQIPTLFNLPLLSGKILFFVYCLSSIYLMLLFHLSLITVNFDRRHASHRYFEFTDMDYFSRFLTFLFLPFTVWRFHAHLFHKPITDVEDSSHAFEEEN